MQQQRKLTTKEKLVKLSDNYFSVLRQQDNPYMDLSVFLEKWVPYFFPGIELEGRIRKEVCFSLTGETLELTYREACVKLLACWYPSVNLNCFKMWGADAANCPDNYKAGLFSINAALEFALTCQAIAAKEKSQALQVEQGIEQHAA